MDWRAFAATHDFTSSTKVHPGHVRTTDLMRGRRVTIQNLKPKEERYVVYSRGLHSDKSPVPVRFARVICAAKWPPAGTTLWEGACRNNDTVKHGYTFLCKFDAPWSTAVV